MARVIVTRPQPQAMQWAQAFEQAGLTAMVLPLIDIRFAADRRLLEATWSAALSKQAIMFVSAAAVDAIAGGLGPAAVRQHAEKGDSAPRLWCTGLGTRARLLHAGFSDSLIDAPDAHAVQYDSEALWARVCNQVCPGDEVLIVRGDDRDLESEMVAKDGSLGSGREWLAEQVRASGGLVEYLVAYERMTPNWSADQRRQAQTACEDASIWVFSSSRALENLSQLMPNQSWIRVRAICTHPRVAKVAQGLGFREVSLSPPGLSAVTASIKSLE